jgi:bacterioferritin-associated ferredoxin
MDRSYTPEQCDECQVQVICRCLRVTEAEVIQVVTRMELRTIKEICREIGAGDGCTCCHPQLQECLEKYSCASMAIS